MSSFWINFWLTLLTLSVLVGAYNLMGILVTKEMPEKVSNSRAKDPRKSLWYFLGILIGALTARGVLLFLKTPFSWINFGLAIAISTILIFGLAGIEQRKGFKLLWWLVLIAIGTFTLEGIIHLVNGDLINLVIFLLASLLSPPIIYWAKNKRDLPNMTVPLLSSFFLVLLFHFILKNILNLQYNL